MIPAGPVAGIDRFIGYYEPYATSHDALDAVIDEVRIWNYARTPAQGARVVARAWEDAAFKARLLAEGIERPEEHAALELGRKLMGEHPDADTILLPSPHWPTAFAIARPGSIRIRKGRPARCGSTAEA